MFKSLLAVLFAVVLVGCEISALTSIDEESNTLLSQFKVASVTCPDTMAVGEIAACTAHNASGTKLQFEDFVAVVGGWESELPSVLEVSISGDVEALAADSLGVLITARGTFNTSASTAVVVVP